MAQPRILIGGTLALGLILIAIFAPIIAPYPPTAVDVSQALEPPSGMHWLGTDDLGRDVWSRTLYGSRISLSVGLIAVGIGLGIGVAIGLVAGYAGGSVDLLLMRAIDALLAFPALILAISITAALGPQIQNAMIAIGVVAVPLYSRLTRGAVIALRDREFVTAARAVGVARGALEDTAAYLQEREQFGHPLADFQALRFALADMAAEVDQGRAFWQQVAHLLDQGVPCERAAAAVKLLTTEMAVRVTGQAMQLHGGNGYTTERRVERYWRDARLTTIFEGTSEIQRKIIADRRPAAPRSDRC